MCSMVPTPIEGVLPNIQMLQHDTGVTSCTYYVGTGECCVLYMQASTQASCCVHCRVGPGHVVEAVHVFLSYTGQVALRRWV